jgi:hypothetical protein
VGTRYEDQPAEHWAGAESLDPTPVWKQYALIALLLVLSLVVIVAFAFAALAPQFATPPALVPGDRLVLSASEIPAVGERPKLIGAEIAGRERSFYLVQPAKGELRGIRVHWAAFANDGGCDIQVEDAANLRGQLPQSTNGPVFFAPCGIHNALALFDLRGAIVSGADHQPDQYLVSVSGDRVIVNLSRVMQAWERTNAPVPTGIPQPQATP